MSSRNIILLVVAVVIAGAVAMALKNRMPAGTAEKPVAEVSTQRILVASRDLPAGSFVKAAGDLQWAAWPAGTVQAYHIKEGGAESMASYEGSVARRSIKAGEAITPNTLVKPGAGGFLSAVLEPGKRAISIAVSATSGTAGFIFPGDRVDLMVTHRMKVQESQGNEDESVVSETFVQNVRVVAVDQMLDNPDNKAILAKTVTLEVLPQQAERIVVAEELGKISMSLRSLAGDETAPAADAAANDNTPIQRGDLEEEDYVRTLAAASTFGSGRVTTGRDVSPALNRKGGAAPRVIVIRGDSVEKREFYQSGQ